MFKPDLIKSKEFLFQNKIYILSILMGLLISVPVSIYKNQQREECEALEYKVEPICKLVKDKKKLKFISAHKFAGEKVEFENFVDDLAQKYHSKIANIEIQDESKIANVNVQQIRITGFFWHDVFIFAFLEELQDFSPGFLNILSVDIDKFSKQISSQKPILKLEVVCKIYQK